MSVTSPPRALRHLSLAVTGHRHNNPALEANLGEVEAVLDSIFDQISGLLDKSADELGPVRLHNLLAEGVDQITAQLALDRDWQVVAPLPFGTALNAAINLQPATPADAQALLEGRDVSDAQLAGRVARLRALTDAAQCFALAERDEEIAAMYRDALAAPDDFARRRTLEMQINDRVTLAGRVMIEQADLLIAVWDGKASNFPGGTGHTIMAALCSGTPVVLIDPSRPAEWTIHTLPEEIGVAGENGSRTLDALIDAVIGKSSESAPTPLETERWHRGSHPMWLFYRWLEKTFGGEKQSKARLVAKYERPDEIAEGSARAMIGAARGMEGVDTKQLDSIVSTILPQFAWSDGISSWLSDAYRSGMCLNFMLAAFAVIIGAAYLPLGLAEQKWIFATIELLLLMLIVAITLIGKRYAWHANWFETRRVAEYLRHGPIMLLLGVFRPTGKWPKAEGREWPEQYSRHCLRSAGLPNVALTRQYLRAVVDSILLPHVTGQRDYHRAKAKRLRTVDHRLDRIAETLFVLAIISVSIYLVLKLGSAFGVVPYSWPTSVSMLLTFLGIAFPTLGASIAGIRFFADFERFAAISQVTAGKLDNIALRIDMLLQSPDAAITFGTVSDLAHGVDAVVVEELENWQAVFSGKHISLPA